MKSRRFDFDRILLSVAAVISFPGLAKAAAITWDDGVGNDLWSSGTNWTAPDAVPASIDDVTFGATGTSTTAGTVTNIVDASTTINSLLFTNVGTATHTTQINSAQMLTVSGALAGAFTVNNTTAGSSNVTITGQGTLAVTGGQTTTSFLVGAANAAAGGSSQTLNMAGLANFSASVATMNLGTGQRGAATVTLASANTITATSVSLGGNTATGGSLTTLNLGLTNTINSNTINVGGGRSSATLQFLGSLSSAAAIIRNTAGTGAAALNVGVGNTNASGIGAGIVDFSGGGTGTVDALFGTVTIGQSANGSGGGSGSGTLSFGQGTIGATTMNIGIGNSGTSTGATGIGIVNMNANAGTLTATTVTMGIAASASNNGNGTWNQNGGNAVITTLNIGNRNSTGTANVTATYNLAGGTLKAQTIQAGNNGSGAGTVTRVFNWTGGTIQNLNSSTDLTIASTNGLSLNLNGAGTQKFTADTSRNIAVNAAITGTGGFTKDGSGTLTLSGANNYSGTTTITGGTLALTGAGSIASPNIIVGATTTFDVSAVTGGFTLANGQTLSGPGTVAGAMTVVGTLSPGNSPGTLAAGSQIWLNGGDYNWQILDATGVAGTGYDTIAVTGTLDLSSLTAGNFGLNLWSLSSIGPDVSGNATNFNNLLTQSWTILTTTGGIAGFDAADFLISTGANNGTAGFSNPLDGGAFSLNQSGNNLVLSFAPIPEPGAALLGGFGILTLLRRRRN